MSIQISVVIPLYNEEENIDILFKRVIGALESLKLTYEIICINDGSKDKTLDILIDYYLNNSDIKVINLSRNFGKDIALTAGIDYASGNAVIPIDADLQDPPELIGEMVLKWQEGYDIVYATRKTRQSETWFKRSTANAFYVLLGKITKISIPRNTGDFRLLDRKAVEALKRLPERTRFMRGLFAWVGFKSTYILFERQPRYQGNTKWNYWKLWNFALDGITSFSLLPLKIWTYVGLIISLLSLFYASFLVIRTIFLGIDVPGYASLMVTILFLGGIQLITLGIIGEYLGRVYEEIKGRPLYIVRDLYGLDKQN